MVRQLGAAAALITLVMSGGVTGAFGQNPRSIRHPPPIGLHPPPPVPQYTAWGHVSALETGWSQDTMSITLDPTVPFLNGSVPIPPNNIPLPCSVTNAGYALDPADPGVKVHEAALLSALASRKWVRLVVFGCVFNKPKVIGVGLSDEHPP
jgi:hypothetical protein